MEWIVVGCLAIAVLLDVVLASWTVVTGQLPVPRLRASVAHPFVWAAGAVVQAAGSVWLALEIARRDLVGPLSLWWLGPVLVLAGSAMSFILARRPSSAR